MAKDLEYSKPVHYFRWAVFLLAAFYFAQSFMTNDPENLGVGWQFRYLTNWALIASLISAYFMIRRSRGDTANRYDAWASITVVINMLVVFLYWKLFFTDPKLVQGDNHIPWWLQYYIHLWGPLLQWIDAFFILGAFRRIKVPVLGLTILMLSYVAWCELIVGPFNQKPVGSVTTGLPYPFMNNMALDERAVFYGTTIVTGLIFFFACLAVVLFLRLLRRKLI